MQRSPHQPRQTLCSTAALSSILCLAACQSPLSVLRLPTDTARDAELRQGYAAATAASVHARAVLRVAGQESELSLLFEAHPPSQIKLAALDDLGGTLFQVERTAGATKVLRASPFIPEDLIADGIVEDLALIFLRPKASGLELRQRADQSLVLRGDNGAHDLRYAGDPNQAMLSHWRAGRNGMIEREIEVMAWSETQSSTESKSPHPERIRVRNLKLGYELLLRVVEWRDLLPGN